MRSGRNSIIKLGKERDQGSILQGQCHEIRVEQYNEIREGTRLGQHSTVHQQCHEIGEGQYHEIRERAKLGQHFKLIMS